MRYLEIFAVVAFFAILGPAQANADSNSPITDGLGAYFTAPHPGGFFGPSDPSPPKASYRTAAMMKIAAPTNQWYSSLMFERWSYPLFAIPVSYRAGPDGFEVGVPTPTVNQAKSGFKEVIWPHRAELTISPTAFKPVDARLAGRGDWNVEVQMANGSDKFDATILHGSPFSYYKITRGDVRLKFDADAVIAGQGVPSGVASFVVDGHPYAVFGPSRCNFTWVSPRELILHLPADSGYFSVAALPNDSMQTIELFKQHAYAFVTNTRAEWTYDAKTSRVITHFVVTTHAMQGGETVPILGLYPHQWFDQSIPGLLPDAFPSVRGTIKLLAADAFTTRMTYHGIVPFWPKLPAAVGGSRVDSLLGGDVAKMYGAFGVQGPGTYWIGKGLGRAAQLMDIAAVQGKAGEAQKLENMLTQHMEDFFSGKNSSTYFVVDRSIGTTIGYPQEYGSVSHMNDHHFHYGYWINAAAQVALRDPTWAAKDHWGGMVDQLVHDIATDRRGLKRDPYLRNFDPYEGHSWASGDEMMNDGNNQESSSEAVNAWAGLIFWGAATGDDKLRNLGIYLYTTEVNAIDDYWFDIHHIVFAKNYNRVLAAQVFGDKYAYNTWWTQNPREVQGINLLPITPASTYLGRDPKYIKLFFDGLKKQEAQYASSGMSDGTPSDIWQDIFAEYKALAFPKVARGDWSSQGSSEAGDSRTHAYYWIKSLQYMGEPDFGITADTPLYAVFKKAGGAKTYLAFNPGDRSLPVKYSDGEKLDAAPHALTRMVVSAPGATPEISESKLN